MLTISTILAFELLSQISKTKDLFFRLFAIFFGELKPFPQLSFVVGILLGAPGIDLGIAYQRRLLLGSI